MRSIARRIESGPTRGREGPEASKRERERREIYERERDKGNEKEIRGEWLRETERKERERERKTERKIIKERERTEGEET